MLFLQPGLAHAAPAGGQVVSGSANITQSGATGQSTTTITQSSDKLSLSWQSFNVGTSETVNFVQPSATALAVNRIYDTQGSQILGRINANGQVWLINPNGVVFGQGAQVNVGALVASTLDTGDATLGQNTQRFSGNSTARVTNLGQINASQGGYVALLGHSVSNQGDMSAPGGTVALGAGNAVSLNFAGSKLLGLQVEQNQLNALAANGGLIHADGGQVLLSAGARDSLLASAVNNTGIVQARTVQSQGGKIVLLGGMAAGTTNVGGTLDASAPDGAKGGFIETSAHTVNVADGARITTASVLGKAGTWLIDPADFTVASTGGNLTGVQLSAALGKNSVEIQSSSGTEKSTSQGNVNIYDAVTWTSGTTLTLTASKDVNITKAVTGSGPGAALVINSNTANGEGNVVSGSGRLNASGVLGGTMSLTLNGSGTGSSYLSAANTYTGDTVITGGTLYVGNGSTGSIASSNISNAGSLRFYRNSDITYAGDISGSGSVTQYGSGTLTLSGSNTYTGTTWVRAGTLALGGGNAIGDRSAVSISAGASLNVLDSETIGSLSGSAATTTSAASAVAIGSGATLTTGGTNISTSFAGVISGEGNLTKTGTASLTLAGDNTYTGETAITGGTLYVGNGSTGSIASGTISNAGSLRFYRNSDITYAGNISGTGSVTQYGSGTLTLSGSNTYTGTTWVRAGTLALRGGSAIGDRSAVSISAGASLNVLDSETIGSLSGSAATAGTGASAASAVAIGSGATLTTGGTNISTSFAGVISGEGNLTKTGTASLTLAGDNTYTGETAITGGTLIIQSDAPKSFSSLYYGSGTLAIRSASASFGNSLDTSGWAIGSQSRKLSNLYLGKSGNAADINIGQNHYLSGTLALDSKGNITQSASISARALAVLNARSAKLDNATNSVSTLAAANVGDLTYVNEGNLTIGAVGSTKGISASGLVDITTGQGDLAINANIDATAGALSLASARYISASGAIDVGTFTLKAGNWRQVSSLLPQFKAKDFRLNGGTFVRALSGNGSESSKYQLTDVYGLQGVGTLLDQSYALATDIDASGTSAWNGGKGFSTIGGHWSRFGGTFDGMNHAITHLTINRPDAYFVGLFGGTETDAVIRNVSLQDINITGHTYVGGLVGFNDGSVSNSYASGSVRGEFNVGGLVGSNNGTLAGNLSYSGTVTGSGENIGGLIGYNTANLDGSNGEIVAVGNVIGGNAVGGLVGLQDGGTISGVSVSSSVQGDELVGGLVGLNYGAIVSSSSTGTVNGAVEVGGLVGGNTGDIRNSYATGKVNGVEFVGGLVGLNSGSIGNSYATGTVRGIANVAINSSGNNVGGLVGANDDQASISNSYATGDVSGALGVAGLAGVNYGAISRSWASGNVSGVFNVGGLVGDNFNSISDTYATGDVSQIYSGAAFISGNIGGLVGINDVTGSISSSYSTGYVQVSRAAGGLVGVSFGTITHSYFNQTNNPQLWGVGAGNDVSKSGVTPLYSVQFKDPAQFKDFDFDTTWVMVEGSGYPQLRGLEWHPVASVYPPTTGPVDLSIHASK